MAEFAKEAANYERDVRKECGVLLKKEDEWELKNRSVSQLTRMVAMYQDSDIENLQNLKMGLPKEVFLLMLLLLMHNPHHLQRVVSIFYQIFFFDIKCR